MRLLILLVCLIPLAVSADTKVFTCEYTSYSDATGSHESTDVKPQAIFVDEEDEAVYLMVDEEIYDYQLVISADRLIIYQVTNAGSLNSITIDKNFDVVFSRNTLRDGVISPS